MYRNCSVNGTRTSFEKGADNSQKVAGHLEERGKIHKNGSYNR